MCSLWTWVSKCIYSLVAEVCDPSRVFFCAVTRGALGAGLNRQRLQGIHSKQGKGNFRWPGKAISWLPLVKPRPCHLICCVGLVGYRELNKSPAKKENEPGTENPELTKRHSAPLQLWARLFLWLFYRCAESLNQVALMGCWLPLLYSDCRARNIIFKQGSHPESSRHAGNGQEMQSYHFCIPDKRCQRFRSAFHLLLFLGGIWAEGLEILLINSWKLQWSKKVFGRESGQRWFLFCVLTARLGRKEGNLETKCDCFFKAL